jgi:hypothetical protein
MTMSVLSVARRAPTPDEVQAASDSPVSWR